VRRERIRRVVKPKKTVKKLEMKKYKFVFIQLRVMSWEWTAAARRMS
jgi:hypothetical protein